MKRAVKLLLHASWKLAPASSAKSKGCSTGAPASELRVDRFGPDLAHVGKTLAQSGQACSDSGKTLAQRGQHRDKYKYTFICICWQWTSLSTPMTHSVMEQRALPVKSCWCGSTAGTGLFASCAFLRRGPSCNVPSVRVSPSLRRRLPLRSDPGTLGGALSIGRVGNRRVPLVLSVCFYLSFQTSTNLVKLGPTLGFACRHIGWA